jgi:hypothetical protein
MVWGQLFNILAAIVGVASTTVIVSSPNTSGIITAFGSAFASSLKAAMGH